MNRMHLGKFLVHLGITAVSTIATIIPLQAKELGPEVVLNAVYQGLRQIDTTQANPKVRWNVSNGSASDCGAVGGSMYCRPNNTIYITAEHIQMAYKHGDAALAYILSHEYAHAAQAASNVRSNNTTERELQADCLAGYYMGLMPEVKFDLQDIQKIATLAYELGDYEFNKADHHGTPTQRTKAVVTGFVSSLKKNGIAACPIRG